MKTKSNSIYDRQLYHAINETASKLKYCCQMNNYIPRNDSDELNPKYLLQGIANDLLVAIVKK